MRDGLSNLGGYHKLRDLTGCTLGREEIRSAWSDQNPGRLKIRWNKYVAMGNKGVNFTKIFKLTFWNDC